MLNLLASDNASGELNDFGGSNLNSGGNSLELAPASFSFARGHRYSAGQFPFLFSPHHFPSAFRGLHLTLVAGEAGEGVRSKGR
jgi:hypothetical protein